ncbi:MAG: hypothetical protein RRZ85_03575 [Gordonibacter sp.]|uniref:hypothetical protein n=1 Tax=Gordonibacter sp. TaxID=1968902 RepID=UPI002FCA7EB4
MFKIATDKLLLVAGIVWAIAGANIANIGLGAFWHDWGWIAWALLAGIIVVYVLFHVFIFTKMVKKHAARIRGYEEDRTFILKFFDKQGYIMMSIMMGGGIALRMSGLIPDWFFAFFYTGLGIALMVAGISFIIRYFRSPEPGCPVMPSTYAKHDEH